ncbi:hypothetical protein LCM20_11850 [Halobacillus litoralis]|uniref:hypothetical protein n=1 Tax=Halobacillus litoralis TaxID=45668 RepID=UPI001CD693E2|nr:hypothetical protein [Halobacillus litoralis]MCA0971290.1 hypothetical protein [Halobacillus litoralis]
MQIPPYMMARAVALLVGILFYYILSQQSNAYKKKVVERTLSLFSIVFVWMFVFKFVTHFPLLLDRPLALLAYPSGTLEFYLAVGMTAVYYVIDMKRGKVEQEDMHVDLFRVLSGTMFVYYFLITIALNEAPFYELSLWFVLYIGSWVVGGYYALLVSCITAFVMSVFSDGPDFMGIRIDASFYIGLCIVFVVMNQLKKRM